MANLNQPCGFRPFGKINKANVYVAGGTVYPGDFVKLDNTGRVVVVAATNTILGLCLNYAVAGADVLVIDDPEQRYIGQADETELDAQTDIGNNCDVLATAGDATYFISRMQVDSSSVAASSLQLTVLGVEKTPINALGTVADVIVKVNKHQLVDAFAGI